MITSHNCGLCNESFRAANRMSKSSIKFDLKSLNNVVHMMKIDPHLSARHLRSILVGCVPPETDISSDYISSFRKRYQIYHAKNPDAHLLTGKVASKLISPSRFSNKELDVLADPVVIKKFRSIDANIMQSGSNTWKTLAYLKKLKTQSTGFDFRMHFDEEDAPDGIVWITLTMRRNLL